MKATLIIIFSAMITFGSWAQTNASKNTETFNQNVYWLHGFQLKPFHTSDLLPGRWDLYSNKFQSERKMISFNPNYARNETEIEGGVDNATKVLESRMTSDDEEGALVIGHSMGGIVARQLDINGNKKIKGIITVGACNKGARIARSLNEGKIHQAFFTGAFDLQRGPGEQSIQTSFMVITAFKFAEKIWGKSVTEEIFETLPERNSQTVKDLIPNSNYMQYLSSREPNVPIINIVTIEDNNEALRMFRSNEVNPETVTLHKHSDGKLNSQRVDLESYYKFYKDLNLTKRFLSPFTYAYYNQLAKNWKAGESYLDHGFKLTYDEVMGANSYIKEPRVRYHFVCEDGSGGGTSDDFVGRSIMMPIQDLPDPYDCSDLPGCEEGCYWKPEEYTVTITIREPNDGLIPWQDQIAKGVSSDMIIKTSTVNHMEVGNHPEMTDIFNGIFNRKEESYVFYVPKR